MVELAIRLDPQTGPQDRPEHRVERVLLLDRAVVDRRCILVRVAAGLVPGEGQRLEVVVLDGQVVVAEHPTERVELGQQQPPARPQQRRHHPGPAVQVRQPVDRPEAGVDDVEAFTQRRLGLVHVRAHEPGVQAEVCGQSVGHLDRRRREVEPDHRRAPTGPGHRVVTEVALEVHQTLPGEVAEQVRFPGLQRVAAGAERGVVVHRRGDVVRDALVPPGPVQLEVGRRVDRLLDVARQPDRLRARVGHGGTRRCRRSAPAPAPSSRGRGPSRHRRCRTRSRR